MATFTVISPSTGLPINTLPFASADTVTSTLSAASAAFLAWRATPLATRIRILRDFITTVESQTADIAAELTHEMGRPISYTASEVSGFCFRGRHMLDLAATVLAPIPVSQPELSPRENFARKLVREPVGVVMIISAWNYPYLVAVNGVIPALAAGNAVIFKTSPQTPTVAERITRAASAAGIPDGVLSYLHLSNDQALSVVTHPSIAHVHFTGSVANGARIQRAIANGPTPFTSLGLELGGKDSAYVRADVADVSRVAAEIADGAFFNSGQSCCGIERVYVHENVYEKFCRELVRVAEEYVLGDPTTKATTLGPVISIAAAKAIHRQVADAVAAGATQIVDLSKFSNNLHATFLPPMVLTNVNHSMAVMAEETFGPVVGVMKVTSDAEAVQLMNNSKYGLTASIWSSDVDAADSIGQQLECGTVYLNRCDYLDPGLAWTGCKDSGRGCTLSQFGFDGMTRVKSYHFKKTI